MKKIMVIVLMLPFYLGSSAQTKKVEDIFSKYQNMNGVISINVARPMFALLNKLEINTSEKTINNLKGMLKGINSLKLLAVENALWKELPKELAVEKLPAEKFKQLTAEINLAVAEVNYMELITVNAKGRSLKFLTAKSDGTVIDNLLLSITSETEGNLLLFLDGKIAMEDVNKFIAAEND